WRRRSGGGVVVLEGEGVFEGQEGPAMLLGFEPLPARAVLLRLDLDAVVAGNERPAVPRWRPPIRAALLRLDLDEVVERDERSARSEERRVGHARAVLRGLDLDAVDAGDDRPAGSRA